MFGVRAHLGVLLHPVPLTAPLSHHHDLRHLLLRLPDVRKSKLLGVVFQLEYFHPDLFNFFRLTYLLCWRRRTRRRTDFAFHS